MSQDERRSARPAAGSGQLDGSDHDSFRWSEIRHFLYAPARRPLLVLGPWAGIVLLSVVALFVLPKKYMSSTFILVESEKVPESFIAKVATRDRSERLQAVKPEILSRTRLERVLDETQPYPDLDSKTSAVEKLRKGIFINVSGNDGLSIEFYHSDPRKAQQVTDRLATLFIEETIKSREQQVEGAVDFLVTQVKDAAKELETKDVALRSYKEQHMGRLPEQLQTNLATMQMLQREAQTVEESLFFTREKQETLARGVGRAPASGGAGTAAPPGSADLADLHRQLAALRTRYTDEHPDVQSIRTRIARLEARQAEASAEGQADADSSVVVTRSQLDKANLEVKKLEDRQRDLLRRIATLRTNVEETPRTEQELSTLTRDYQQLKDNYTALLGKQLEAQMSGRLEQRWKGDRFRMLDPASLPERPVFPKPTMFIGLGAVLGLIIGLGVSLVAEYLDPTVKDSEGLQAVQGYPVLACIPHFPALGGPATPARLVSLNRAAARHFDAHRKDAEKLWGPSAPGEVGFHDEGVVTPTRVVPILDSLRDHNSIVGEELRLLVANLTDLCRRRGASCLALTSALPGEGKSTVSLGLAGALARDPGRRVLLIEADLRRPSLSATLGLPPAPGLSEWLNGTLESVPVRVVEPAGFYLVAAGQTGLKRPEILGSPRMDALLRTARGHFDFVILDLVPVLPVADAILMQDLVDGFLLVARSRQTPRDAITDALAKLRSERIAGIVLNDHREYRGSYKDHFYQRYGMGHSSLPPAGLTARAPVEMTPLAAPAVTPAAAPAVAEAAPAAASRTASGGGWMDGPGAGRSIVPALYHEQPARQSVLTMPLATTPVPAVHPEPAPAGRRAREAAAGFTFHRESPEATGRKPLVVAASVIVLVLAGAVGYLAVRPRLSPPSTTPVDAARASANSETAAALERVRVLEQRLQAIEAEKTAAETRAAEEARKKVVAQAAARGRTADPAVLVRAQEEARRQAQVELDRRLRDEQDRLKAEQRVVEGQLAEQARKEEEARMAAAAVASPTVTPAPAAVPTTTLPPAIAPTITIPPAVAAAPPAPTGRTDDPVSLSDPGVIGPVLERAGQPNYPPAALRQRLEGTVQLLVLVDETGAVIDSRIVAGASGRFGFNEAALGSVKGRKYRPATRDGVPVKVWLPVRVQFKLP